MKTYILLVGLLISLSMSAQDIITQVNGDEIEAKVLKVSNLEVEYKKWSNTEGPTYTIPVDEIFMIKYVNGDKDVFANHAQEQKKVEKAEPDSPVITDASPLPVVNDSLISLYNDYSHIYREQKKEKKTKKEGCFLGSLGIAKGSVIAGEHLTIKLVQECNNILGNRTLNEEYEVVYNLTWNGCFNITITNNSNSMIYIDKASSFSMDQNSITRNYYNDQQMSISDNHSSGGGLNLGAVAGAVGVGGAVGTLASGIGIGGSHGTSVTKNYSDNQILTIAPNCSAVLSTDKRVITKKNGAFKFDKAINTSLSEHLDLKMLELEQGEVLKFEESNTLGGATYSIIYSTDPNFKHIYKQNFKIYLKDAVRENRTCWTYEDVKNKIVDNVSPYTIFVEGTIGE